MGPGQVSWFEKEPIRIVFVGRVGEPPGRPAPPPLVAEVSTQVNSANAALATKEPLRTVAQSGGFSKITVR